jgi:DNA-binding transcriptional regulator GbsR (MarR family)
MEQIDEILKKNPPVQAESIATFATLPIRPKLKETRLFLDNEYFSEGYAAKFPNWVTVVYGILAKYANAKEQTCFPSYETIMKGCGVSRNKVNPAIKVLEIHNIIAVQRSRGGKKKPNQYILLSTTVWESFNNTYLNTVLRNKKNHQTVPDLYAKQYLNEYPNSTPVDTVNQLTKSTNEINDEPIKKLDQLRQQLKNGGILKRSTANEEETPLLGGKIEESTSGIKAAIKVVP